MNETLEYKILKLRQQGQSIRNIAKTLNCSKSTVSYYCSEGQKEKTKLRKNKIEKWLRILMKKIDNFKRSEKTSEPIEIKSDWNHIFRTKVSTFRTRNKMKPLKNYTYKDVIDHFGGTKVKCALTGRDIDITKDSYSLDHILPVDKGGTNELSNMEIVCPEANMSKSNMTNDEYINLCIEVLTNFGYKVSK